MSSTTTAAGPDGPSSNGEAAAPAPLVAGPQMQPVMLSDPLDEDNLTDAVKFCRRQIEFFTADPEDVHARHKKGGIKQDIYVGQVGIRCVHCARLGKTKQPSGSVSYPASISLVYQAVRNWQSELVCCMYICLYAKAFPVPLLISVKSKIFVMCMCCWILHCSWLKLYPDFAFYSFASLPNKRQRVPPQVMSDNARCVERRSHFIQAAAFWKGHWTILAGKLPTEGTV